MAKHFFVINPKAGVKSAAKRLEEAVRRLFREDPELVGEELEIAQTLAPGDATRLVSEYCNRHENDEVRVYACGGDGTLHEAVNGIVGFDNAALCPVPVGSGNDFIRVFEPVKREDFLNLGAMVRGKTVSCDVLRCGDFYSINNISAGLDAYSAKRQQKVKRIPLVSGGLAYKLALGYSFLTAMKNPIRFEIDGESVTVGEGNVTLAVLGNGKYYGGGFKATPLADISDGKMDLCTVPTLSRMEFLKYVGDYKKGEHLKTMPAVVYRTCRRLRLISDQPIVLQADGEIFEAKNPEIEVVPAAIRLVVPDGVDTLSLAKTVGAVVESKQ
ncbi:MAG: diacylglycerol kinase family lipid kinase [Clostridia bacterium]|nr:diacylglycerol kinase family lipid kinase [Clostridia bacterium]